MWYRFKKKRTKVKAHSGVADTLISEGTRIKGDISYSGVLYVNGHVEGNIVSNEDNCSVLIIGETGLVEGEVQVPYLIIYGKVIGDLFTKEHAELHPSARIVGSISYKGIEIMNGAEINGQLLRQEITASLAIEEQSTEDNWREITTEE